ncbi:MAG: 7TM diverse intracellular signaling domain-containing protein, partial [Myxococcota bacterium]|nr:7TM diverse intracellular signaling domain-containing protein [Myxococcota bacterium]
MAVVCLTLGSAVASAEVPVISVGQQDEQVIGGDVEILVDPDGQISFEETWSDSGKLKFQKSEKEVPNFGFSDSAIWVRFSLANATGAPLERLFSIGYALLDEVIIEVRQGGEIRRFEYGDLKPFAERDFYHRHFIVPLRFESNERLDIRVRITSESSLRVPLTLWDDDAFYKEDVIQMLINGLYYGLMLVMALYNAFVYFSIRERSYLVYVCFVVSAAIAQLAMSGLSYQFLWPTWPWWGGVSVVLGLALGTIFAGLFTLEFLQLKSTFPRVAKPLQIVVGLSTILAVASFFIPYGYAARGQLLLIMLAIPICVTAGVISWRAGSVEAKFYSIAWFSFLGGAMLLALTYGGVLPANAITTRGHEVGGALLVVLLSLAL